MSHTVLTIVLLFSSSLIGLCEADTEKELSELKKELSELKQYVKQEIGGLEKEIAGLKSDAAKAEKEIAGLKSDAAKAETEIAALKSDAAKAVYKDKTGKLPHSLLPDSLVYKDGTGRITQDILPGSYANYTVEDMMWKSQHQAAVAACNKFGSHNGYVIPVTTGSTCSDTCSSWSSYYRCSGVVTVASTIEKSTEYRSYVGSWYKGYTCSTTSSYSEVSKKESYILGNNYLHYCCCTN